MDEKLTALKSQIQKINNLREADKWGPEFQLWLKKTENLVYELFGAEGLVLFKNQRTMTTSYTDDEFNWQQYLKELTNREKILEGLLSDYEQFDITSEIKPEIASNVLKEIWRKEAALKENLLPIEEAKSLQQALLTHLEKTLKPDSLPGLRFKKYQSKKVAETWWETDGYPAKNPWPKFQPFLELLEQHEAEKTIKHRFEGEGLFVESRSQGEDQHLLVGNKDGTAEKAHVIIDGKTGDIRIEENRQEPTELVSKIEALLTLPSGKVIRTTREAVEQVDTLSSNTKVQDIQRKMFDKNKRNQYKNSSK